MQWGKNPKTHFIMRCFRFYKILGNQPGLPKVFHYGPCGKYNALVMELLGPNLEELFQACNYKFSIKTILLLALQLLSRVEFIHSNGIVYRDIKPENCVVGRTTKANMVHMVDFGLAKEFLDPETGKHIHYNDNKSLTGTVRYMSINSHQGKEQSRRDDLEALGHVFFYFLTGGKLPWQGVKCDDIRKRYQIIGQIKEDTRISELGNRFPWEFSLYLRYCRALKFSQQPDYIYLKNLFRGCLTRMGEVEDDIFDWMKSGFKVRRFDSSDETVVEYRRDGSNLAVDDKPRGRIARSDDSVVLRNSDNIKESSKQQQKKDNRPIATIEPFVIKKEELKRVDSAVQASPTNRASKPKSERLRKLAVEPAEREVERLVTTWCAE